jgi:hypothetical protein
MTGTADWAEGFDWHRIAVQLARYGGSYHGLTTAERDALEAEVAAENEREWGTDHERAADASDRGTDD